jgi:hypothetical protein
MVTPEITPSKTPSKTGLSSNALKRRAPNETLTVGEILDRARALLRSRQTPEAYSLWAHRITLLEDWLELEHSTCDRTELRELRRKCENKIADWVEPEDAKARRMERHRSHVAHLPTHQPKRRTPGSAVD